MRRDPEEALRQFYDACASAPLPPTIQTNPANEPWSWGPLFRWAMLGPAFVLLMLAIVDRLPTPAVPDGGMHSLYEHQARALGLLNRTPNQRRTELDSKSLPRNPRCNV